MDEPNPQNMEGFLGQVVEMILNDDDEEVLPAARRLRYLRERVPHFDDLDDKDFLLRFRFSKEMMLDLLTKIDHQLEYPTDK